MDGTTTTNIPYSIAISPAIAFRSSFGIENAHTWFLNGGGIGSVPFSTTLSGSASASGIDGTINGSSTNTSVNGSLNNNNNNNNNSFGSAIPFMSAVVKFGDTPLSIACRLQNLEIVQYLIDHGANVNDSYSNGKSLLHLESEGHRLFKDSVFYNYATMQLLIWNGADPRMKDDFGYFPLDYALLAGIEIIDYSRNHKPPDGILNMKMEQQTTQQQQQQPHTPFKSPINSPIKSPSTPSSPPLKSQKPKDLLTVNDMELLCKMGLLSLESREQFFTPPSTTEIFSTLSQKHLSTSLFPISPNRTAEQQPFTSHIPPISFSTPIHHNNNTNNNQTPILNRNKREEQYYTPDSDFVIASPTRRQSVRPSFTLDEERLNNQTTPLKSPVTQSQQITPFQSPIEMTTTTTTTTTMTDPQTPFSQSQQTPLQTPQQTPSSSQPQSQQKQKKVKPIIYAPKFPLFIFHDIDPLLDSIETLSKQYCVNPEVLRHINKIHHSQNEIRNLDKLLVPSVTAIPSDLLKS